MSQCDPNRAIHVETPNVLIAPLPKTLLLLHILKQIPGQKKKHGRIMENQNQTDHAMKTLS